MQLNELAALNLDVIQDELCVVAAGHPMAQLGDDLQTLCLAFEARGTFHLLETADLAAFSMNLRRSGQARRYFLRKSGEQRSTDVLYTALSRTGAVFDCIAAGDWPLALEIRALSPAEWRPRGEYHEDFCYHNVVYACAAAIVDRNDAAAASSWCEQLESVVADIPGSTIDVARLSVCKAFLTGDEHVFWPAFEGLVEASGAEADAVPLADGRVFEFPWLAADRHVSIELVAWVTLARARRFTPAQREYRRCPSLAQPAGPPAPLPDIFDELERQFRL